VSDALFAAMREEFAKFFERLEQHSVGAPPDSGSAQSDAFAKGIADFDAWAARVDRRLAAVEQQHALLLEELRAVHAQRTGLSLAGVRLVIPDHALGLPVLRALSLCRCCRHYPGAADGHTRRSEPPTHVSLPRNHYRVGLHIVLFEIL